MSDIGGWRVGDERSLTHTFTAREIDAFASLTGDTNPLHVDAAYANRSAAGGQVVHGMLAASFISTLIGVQIPGRGALWNSFQVDWRKMVRIGDTLRFDARITRVQPASRMLELELTGVHAQSGEVYLHGKARVMMMEDTEQARSGSLAGARVLVTGASGEIGGAICRALSAAGCQVVAWGRDEERLRRLGSTVKTKTVDLSAPEAIASSLEETLSMGRIDGVVHAAAAALRFAEVTDAHTLDDLREHWAVDVAALLQMTHIVAPQMTSGGFIITLLTQSVFDTPPVKQAAYVAAKAGAWGLIRAMAAELGPKGIRCNAVSPSLVETPYVRDMPVRVKQIEAATNPMRRLCTVEDVANAVVFLASPQGSFLNGVNLPVTGGARMP